MRGEAALPVVVDAGGRIEVTTTAQAVGSGTRVDWSVRNPGRRPVRVRRVGVRLPMAGAPARVLEHGWQSWSPVRPCRPGDVEPARRRAPAWRRSMYAAEGRAAGRAVLVDHLLVHDRGAAGFLDGRSHLGTIELVAGEAPIAWALLDGIELGPGGVRVLDPLWFADGDAGGTFAELATHWAAHSGARASSWVPTGWCSWYRYNAEVTPADVRAQLAPAADNGIDLIQIDDGWQAGIGEWGPCSTAWDGELDALAADIRGAGLHAGIWTAPFLVAEHGPTARQHPDWILQDGRGPVRAMFHPRLWGGWALALDTTHPAVLDHLHRTFSALVDRGFDAHKLDFLYAAGMPGRHHDRSATRAEALRLGLGAIRAAVGDDAFVLACGCPFGPAVGLVDAMRVSPDTTVSWALDPHAAGFAHAAPSASNAVRTSRLRSPFHRRLWLNDADCLLLRSPREQRTEAQQQALIDTVAGTAPYVMVSDDLNDYGPDEWEIVRRVRAGAGNAIDVAVDPFADAPVT